MSGDPELRVRVLDAHRELRDAEARLMDAIGAAHRAGVPLRKLEQVSGISRSSLQRKLATLPAIKR